MKRVSGVLGGLASAVLLASPAPVAQAATGQVVVFSVEIAPLETYENPKGCKALPDGAHVLSNLTDGPVTIFSDQLCLVPLVTVEAGYGTHVPTFGAAFRA
ncbi:hypothetical protein [Saccharothrix sp. NRRL B-16314]|uniref:hypothetical protein n=1 Tax=Saccharothrix sp. NRRL B-16314 TaxID=1463825 RepID=UPI00068A2DC8|nr:hypothetical protein [Saccharothrix sp. NRRL B-16314]